MKFLGLILLYLKILHAVSRNCEKMSLLSCALVNITKSLAQNDRKISILNYGSMNVLDEVVSKDSMNEKFSYDIKSFKINRKTTNLVEKSSIMLFDTIEAVKEINSKTTLWQTELKQFKFYIYCKKSTVTTILRNFGEIKNNRKENDQARIIDFQYFLVDEETSIKLFTFELYSPCACRKRQLIEINLFDKKTRKWKHGMFSIKKFHNF
jgi:hypothetical protein